MIRRLTPLSALLVLMALPAPAGASGYTNAIVLIPGYVTGSQSWSIQGSVPDVGSTLLIVGKVQAFGAPFEDLDTQDPEVEYTYVLDGLDFDGVSYWDAGFYGGTIFTYGSGTLSVYRDPSRNVDFSSTSTFSDGELILQAEFTDFVIDCSYLPDRDCPAALVDSHLQFTGGSLFSRVSHDGTGDLGTHHGEYTENTVLPSMKSWGYFAQSWTQVDIDAPTPVLPVSWGTLKARFGP